MWAAPWARGWNAFLCGKMRRSENFTGSGVSWARSKGKERGTKMSGGYNMFDLTPENCQPLLLDYFIIHFTEKVNLPRYDYF